MKDILKKISVNGIVSVSLCIALLICISFGQIDLAQSLVSGLLGFLTSVKSPTSKLRGSR